MGHLIKHSLIILVGIISVVRGLDIVGGTDQNPGNDTTAGDSPLDVPAPIVAGVFFAVAGAVVLVLASVLWIRRRCSYSYVSTSVGS